MGLEGENLNSYQQEFHTINKKINIVEFSVDKRA